MRLIGTFLKLAAPAAALALLFKARRKSRGVRTSASDAPGDDYPGNEPGTYS